MTTEPYSFYSIEVFDEETDFSVHEIYLDHLSTGGLPDFIRQKMQSLAANQTEPLDRESLTKYPAFKAELDAWSNFPVRLNHRVSLRPYRGHSDREFDLMRKGLKPLSAFSHIDPSSGLARFLQKYFDPLVESGEFVLGKIEEEDGSDAFLSPSLLYALSGEAWRIEAYRLMVATARATQWNDALERIEGSLLGYTPQQSDEWYAFRKRNGLRWGRHAMYRFLTDTEVTNVRKTGCKAFLADNGESIQLYLPYVDDQTQPGPALASMRQMPLARFYVQLIKFKKYSEGVIKVSDCDIEVFKLPGSELVPLNEAIDGSIEIIIPGE